VAVELPNIARLADCPAIRCEARQIIGWVVGRKPWIAVHQQVDFAGREAGQLDVKIDLNQLGEMPAQQIEVPHGLFRQTVVGNNNGSFLGSGEPGDRQGWDLGPAKALGRLPASVARKDGAGLVDQDRVRPNLFDAPHQASNLRLGMLPRVPRERLQIIDRKPGDLVLQPARCGRSLASTRNRWLDRSGRSFYGDVLAGAGAGYRGIYSVPHAPIIGSGGAGRFYKVTRPRFHRPRRPLREE